MQEPTLSADEVVEAFRREYPLQFDNVVLRLTNQRLTAMLMMKEQKPEPKDKPNE